ncbi:MAG: hypothetical protein KZQ77_04205, partial [Candidatus Thiodiazotropha sp. (ex Notomyrtea botanica)]|nr:hypothetical protein [Candidatus Thiodiazotropha sp. (ex Notomyrtea botanica)]
MLLMRIRQSFSDLLIEGTPIHKTGEAIDGRLINDSLITTRQYFIDSPVDNRLMLTLSSCW